MRLFFLLVCMAYASVSLQAQYTYGGIFKEVADSTTILEELSWDQLTSALGKLRAQNFQLRDIDLVRDDNKVRFWAIAQEGLATKDTLLKIVRWDSLILHKRALYKMGYEMQDIEHYVGKDGQDHFIAFWHPNRSVHKVWKFDSWRGVEKKIADHTKENLFLVDVEPTLLADGTAAFLAIFHKGGFEGKTYLVRETDFQAFNLDRLNRRKSGFRMIDFEQYQLGTITYYVAIYRRGDGTESLRTKMNKETLEETRAVLKEEEQIQLTDLEITKGN